MLESGGSGPLDDQSTERERGLLSARSGSGRGLVRLCSGLVWPRSGSGSGSGSRPGSALTLDWSGLASVSVWV